MLKKQSTYKGVKKGSILNREKYDFYKFKKWFCMHDELNRQQIYDNETMKNNEA